jgi:transposase-like protein
MSVMSDRFDHTLEHTLETKPADGADGAVTAVRRIELITGASRRRQWSDDDKARIIVESLMPGANVSEVARRNGLSPQQLFGWRRQVRCDPAAGRSDAQGNEARALMAESVGDVSAPARGQASPPTLPSKTRGARPPIGERPSAERVPAFASVVIASPAAASPPSDTASTGRIEIVLGDAVVRVSGQVEAGLITTVLRAVRRTS